MCSIRWPVVVRRRAEPAKYPLSNAAHIVAVPPMADDFCNVVTPGEGRLTGQSVPRAGSSRSRHAVSPCMSPDIGQ